MKWIPRLFAIGSILALIILAGLSYERAVSRRALIDSILHQIQLDYQMHVNPDAGTDDSQKRYDTITKQLKATEQSFTDLVWYGILGLGLSVVGFIAGSPDPKTDVQQSNE